MRLPLRNEAHEASPVIDTETAETAEVFPVIATETDIVQIGLIFFSRMIRADIEDFVGRHSLGDSLEVRICQDVV